MQTQVAEALAAGALGVSTGTYYAPANAATADEIRRVCEPLRGTTAADRLAHPRRGRPRARVDDRGDGDRRQPRRAAGALAPQGDRPRELRPLARDARAARRRRDARSDVCLDCYPYTASSTVLRKDAAAQAQRVLIAWSKARPDAAGRYLDELAADRGPARSMR